MALRSSGSLSMGSIAGTIASGVGRGLAGRAVGRIFGSDSERPLSGFNPAGINFNTPERRNLISGLQGSLREQAGELRGLIPLVQSGSGKLSQAASQAIGARRERSIGNLRENLARRRVSGSSFASDALARAEGEFAKQEGEVLAQTAMQELQLQTQLINQAFAADQNAFNVALQDLNVGAGLGAQLSAINTQVMGGNARLLAQLRAIANEGIGGGFEDVIDEVGRGFGSIFGSRSSGSN